MDYLTLAGEVHAKLEVKRSRFLATVRRVADEEAAAELVAEHRRCTTGRAITARRSFSGRTTRWYGPATTVSRPGPPGCRC